MSYFVGRSLIRRNADRYAREADLRFSLVRINEHVDGIALADGEADERRRVEMHLGNVMIAMRRLVRGLTNLTWVTAGFGWITGIAPILIAAPLYFGGKTTFGGMMMAAAAFTQAQGSLRWFVDNFSAIADWRATLLRVANFRTALLATESQQDAGSRIEYAEGAPGVMAFEDLQVDSPVGREGFQEQRVVIRAGEHVLICGAPGEGKTPLFRALSGLWPWGSGRIVRPRGESVMYVPRGTPYLPRGTLREALAYPLVTDRFADRAYVAGARAHGPRAIRRRASMQTSDGIASSAKTSRWRWRSRAWRCTLRPGLCSTTRSPRWRTTRSSASSTCLRTTSRRRSFTSGVVRRCTCRCSRACCI